jgi:predicted anti-sigma-YlaC factor YlaD
MPMTCSELVELVTDYLEGVLGPAERATFEDHLAGCPGCQAYLDQTRLTVDALGTLPRETVSDETCAHLLMAFTGRNRP